MTKQQALSSLDFKKNTFVKINDLIWEYAETAFREFKSANLLCDELQKEGFDVKKGVANIETAFTATYGEGKPIIGILAEYDALSGISQKGISAIKEPLVEGGAGHGCGHNCFAAGAFAAAVAVKEYLQNNKQQGTVILFGCPGEEGGSGKAFMAREGVFDCLDAAVTWHPGDVNNVMTGSSLANYQVAYKFKGVSSHAAADPHLGRSALDAVELMNVGVQFLREHMIDQARIHYAITNTGGYSPNVVQPVAEVLYLIRSPKTPQVEELFHRVNDIAKGAALMTGTTLEIEFIKACSNVVVNSTIEKVMYKNFEEVGVATYTNEERDFANSMINTYENPSKTPTDVAALVNPDIYAILERNMAEKKPINDLLLPFCTSDLPMPGSTDVGDVSWICPTAQIHVVTAAAGVPGHSWQFTSCNLSTIAHKGVLIAGKVMAGSVIDLIENPDTIEVAKAELEKKLAGQRYVCPIPSDIKPKAIGPKV